MTYIAKIYEPSKLSKLNHVKKQKKKKKLNNSKCPKAKITT